MLVSGSVVKIIGSPSHQTWNPLHIITVQTVPGFAVKSYTIGSNMTEQGTHLHIRVAQTLFDPRSVFVFSSKRVDAIPAGAVRSVVWDSCEQYEV